MNKKFKRSLSSMLSVAVIAGTLAMNVSTTEAYELKRPVRERPTKETMWQPEHVGNTMTGGMNHSLFITETNTVKTVGENTYGQLGDGTTVDSTKFVNVVGEMGIGSLTDVVSVSGGDYHSMALKTDGTVWTWGRNQAGQLGDGTRVDKSTPVQVSGLTDVVSVGAGKLYSMALKSDGTLWAWGANNNGQLGDGTAVQRNTPIQVLDDVVSISVGGYHSMAIKTDGTVWAWGRNIFGQLGDGTTVQKHTPVQVQGLDDVVSVSGGSQHSMALKADGTVWTWGNNGVSQLGDGTTVNKSTPVQVVFETNKSFLTDIVSVSVGYDHSMALKSDGTVWAWGQNYYGHLGDGTTVDKSTPVQVQGLDNVVSVSAGGIHSMALKADGTVWAWGHNKFGQLGDGTKVQRNTPVKITFVGQKSVTIIPQHMLYNFTNPKERNLYEGGQTMTIEWNLISNSVESFDIYYGPFEGWEDEDTWTEIAKGVPVSALSPSGYTSNLSDGKGGFLQGTTYKHNWMLPDEFIPHIRIIAIPKYK